MIRVKDRLRELIEPLMPNHAEGVLRFHDEYADAILGAKGSSHNHQSWFGGYHDHIVQCLRLARDQYDLLSGYTVKTVPPYPPDEVDLGFKLENAAVVLYFHDIEKIFKYSHSNRVVDAYRTKHKWAWYAGVLPEKYGIWFDQDELNALEYIHGELEDYKKDARVMKPLGAFCHCVDVLSARVFFNVKQVGRKEEFKVQG